MTTKVGRLITEAREARGLSKARLAREALMSNGYLVQIEKGDRTPSETIIRRIARALEIGSYPLLDAADAVTARERAAIAQHLGYAQLAAHEGGWEVTPADALYIAQQIVDYGVGNVRLKAPTPEELAQDREEREYGDQIDEALGYPRHVYVPPPEGWAELSKADRRLVQQLINRLRYVAD